jgi:repressor LexA
MPITPQQHRVLGFVQNYIESKGFPPTQMEIAKKFKLSSLGTVQKHLKGLESKGYLTKAWNGKRAIQLNEVRATAVRIPMSGIVAAGLPIEAIEQNETMEVPSALLRGGENFGLTVKGESMIEEGIRDGDLVIVRKQKTAENGQTVVAMIDGEATVKTFYRKKDGVELHPANPQMQPIKVVSGQGFQILGIVVGLIRKYA